MRCTGTGRAPRSRDRAFPTRAVRTVLSKRCEHCVRLTPFLVSSLQNPMKVRMTDSGPAAAALSYIGRSKRRATSSRTLMSSASNPAA